MYAILQQSGHQYRVSPGDRLVVDHLAAEVGSVVALEPVVLVQNDDGTQVGTPIVAGARVAAVVMAHRKGAKIRVFRYKAKKRYRRTQGHRSQLTELRIEALLAAGEPLPKPKVAEPAPVAEAPAPAAKAAAGKGRGRGAKAKAAAAPEVEALAAVATATGEEVADTGAHAAAADEPEAVAPRKRAPRPRAKKAEAAPTETESETSAPDGETETEA
jgi:large subunit ribosomal protein L21